MDDDEDTEDQPVYAITSMINLASRQVQEL